MTGNNHTAKTDKAGRVLVIACGMLAREVLAIREHSSLDHVDVTCLPAQLHFEFEEDPSRHACGHSRGQSGRV